MFHSRHHLIYVLVSNNTICYYKPDLLHRMSSRIHPRDSVSNAGSDTMPDGDAIKEACKRLINEATTSHRRLKELDQEMKDITAEIKEQIKFERAKLRKVEGKLKPYFDLFGVESLQDGVTGCSIDRVEETVESIPTTRKIAAIVASDNKYSNYKVMFENLIATLKTNKTRVKLEKNMIGSKK